MAGVVGDKGRRKIAIVIGEFKRKKLKSGSGDKVTSRPQALAIALSEARKASGDKPRRKKRRARNSK